jgi:formylglycine-generating enzyme required for sulfatase activity
MQKILILASNPRKDLNLDREIRDLQGVIERSQHGEKFEVISGLAVRVGDLQDLMLKHRPQIVHFCGHGSGKQGLVFEGNDGGEQWVRADALSDLFRLFSNNVGCVLLNACYSEEQANAIVNHIDYVIGMNQEIRDDAAIAFSKGFYRALGYNRPIEEAYEFGRNAIQLEISGSSKMQSAATEVDRKLSVVDAVENIEILEHNKPTLKRKPSLANISIPTLSEDGRVAILLDIERSLEADPKIELYRDQVREYLEDRKLEDYQKILLETLRVELALSIEITEKILAEEQAPIEQAKAAYRQRLNALIQGGFYPLNEPVKNELKKFQAKKNLTEAEVEEISSILLEAAESDYRKKQNQQYKAKLQRYEQEFRREIAAGYPINEHARAGLQSFQKSLGLHAEDVTQIEQPLIAPKKAEYQREQEEIKQKLALENQRKIEQQQLIEQQRNQDATKQLSSLKSFKFRVAKVNVLSKTVEKQGRFGKKKKTETINTCNITYQRCQAEYFVEELSDGSPLEMVAIAGGNFLMGSPDTEAERRNTESPQHPVTIKSFFLGRYPVTQEQWRIVAATYAKVNIELNHDPSEFKGAKRPVEQVSWYEAQEYCDRLAKKTKRPYRLPTEAEWEYACRAETTTPFYFGNTISTELANYDGYYTYAKGVKGEYREKTTPVDHFDIANAWGLHDMHGNLWEWCQDHWHDNYEGAPEDGSAWLTNYSGAPRIGRGGSWFNFPWFCRSAFRFYNNPVERDINLGFRVSCSAP